MVGFLRRLFGTRAMPSASGIASDAAPVANERGPALAQRHTDDGTASLPMNASPINASPIRASPVGALPTPVAYDALTSWNERLAAARALQANDPAAASNPDVTALLQLLAEGPDTVIRQLPAAARDALTMCDDDSLSRTDLASRLSRDPALVQGLLRTANSAAFGAGRDAVLGIDQSLDRIGLSGARAVILSSCVDGLLSHPGGAFNAMASDVWAHMVRTAPLARTVAPAFAADADEAFAIAVLHDVGKLVVFDRVSVLRATRRRAISLPAGFLHALLQLVHEPLGAMAALQWGMGARAAAAIGTHHRSVAIGGRDPLAETIFLAERADHAERRSEPFDLDALWMSGRLTGSPARAVSALQQLAAAA